MKFRLNKLTFLCLNCGNRRKYSLCSNEIADSGICAQMYVSEIQTQTSFSLFLTEFFANADSKMGNRHSVVILNQKVSNIYVNLKKNQNILCLHVTCTMIDSRLDIVWNVSLYKVSGPILGNVVVSLCNALKKSHHQDIVICFFPFYSILGVAINIHVV